MNPYPLSAAKNLMDPGKSAMRQGAEAGPCHHQTKSRSPKRISQTKLTRPWMSRPTTRRSLQPMQRQVSEAEVAEGLQPRHQWQPLRPPWRAPSAPGDAGTFGLAENFKWLAAEISDRNFRLFSRLPREISLKFHTFKNKFPARCARTALTLS